MRKNYARLPQISTTNTSKISNPAARLPPTAAGGITPPKKTMENKTSPSKVAIVSDRIMLENIRLAVHSEVRETTRPLKDKIKHLDETCMALRREVERLSKALESGKDKPKLYSRKD